MVDDVVVNLYIIDKLQTAGKHMVSELNLLDSGN
jgi:hypothetical protein